MEQPTERNVRIASDIERMREAKKGRREQLDRWQNYDQELGDLSDGDLDKQLNNTAVKFPDHIVFLEAAQRNDLVETERMLQKGMDPDTVNEDGLTALHQACINNSLGIARLLVRFNASVNSTDAELWTPLHAAATCGHKQLCQFLISKKANLLALNIDGNMPYDICDDEETLDAIEHEMGNQGITQEDIDETRRIPENEMLEDMRKKVLQKEDMNKFDSQGATPLHIAASLGYEEVTRLVLQAGADPDLPDNSGWRPAHIATCWGHWDLLEILISYGADLEATNSDGQTVFAICESEEMTDKLMEIWSKRDMLRAASRHPDLYGMKRSQTSSRRKSVSNVRRSSNRQKNNMSRREAKEEALKRPGALGSWSQKEIEGRATPLPLDLDDGKIHSPSASDSAQESPARAKSPPQTTVNGHLDKEEAKEKSNPSQVNGHIAKSPIKDIPITLATEVEKQSVNAASSMNGNTDELNASSLSTNTTENQNKIPVLTNINKVLIPPKSHDLRIREEVRRFTSPHLICPPNSSHNGNNPDAFEHKHSEIGNRSMGPMKSERCCKLM